MRLRVDIGGWDVMGYFLVYDWRRFGKDEVLARTLEGVDVVVRAFMVMLLRVRWATGASREFRARGSGPCNARHG